MHAISPISLRTSLHGPNHVQLASHISAVHLALPRPFYGQFLYHFSLSRALPHQPAVTPRLLSYWLPGSRMITIFPVLSTDLCFVGLAPSVGLPISRARLHLSPWWWRQYRLLKHR
jgi:hypothetical protein